ncbi:hypothetical protein EYE40_14855 [Glaciihabitans arcticus]|uniref:DUF3558 domain-containing protein n=1 Tax=Glaciihabitans arcticus TaxID=2668039 RepID=A0A4Q9GM23_9MICO|nr:hypothetical protein [Glaciihabitans arcticus]TBN55479.1 hypothetical protein EYE40_14855 [Glaciihabitans arcticus]
MVKGDRIFRASLVVLSIALAATLSGCGEDTASGERIVDTKGPTQILRNDAASRVDESMLLSADRKTDISESCGLEAKDPDGLMRYWHSGINLNLDTSSAESAQSEGEKLVASYVSEDWEATTQSGSDGSTTILENKASEQEIRVTVTNGGSGGLGAMITVDVYGPCVETGGPDSEEIKNLES